MPVIDAADRAGLRHKARLKTFQPTSMRCAGQLLRVHLLDLSATGALVHCTTPPAPGDRVHLACGGETRSARVVWTDRQRFGVAFTVPLTDGLVAQTIDTRREAVAVAAQRVGMLVR